jgi:hypothetical protein
MSEKIISLERQKELLIKQRNKIVDSPFYLFRKSLQEKLCRLDVELDQIDLEIFRERGGFILEKEFIEEMQAIEQQLKQCIDRLKTAYKIAPED